jgi:hypothetical protein
MCETRLSKDGNELGNQKAGDKSVIWIILEIIFVFKISSILLPWWLDWFIKIHVQERHLDYFKYAPQYSHKCIIYERELEK